MWKNNWLLPKIMTLFAIIAINISCEKDLYEDAVYKPEKSTIKEVKFDELFKDSKFKNLLQSVSNNSNIARSAFENQNGFTISNTNVKVIQTDSVTSYTMLIQRDSISNSSYFENLVIQEDIFNNQKAFIIKYTPNQITSTVDNSFAFQGEIRKSQIAFTGFNRSGSYQNTTQSVCNIEVLMCSYGEHHVAGQGCVDKPNPTLYLKKIAVLCQDNGGGSGGSSDISIGDPFNGGGSSSGSDGDGLGDPFSGGGSSTGGSGTGSTGTNNEGFDSEVVTSPVSNQDIINTYIFYNSLSPNQQSWADENVETYNQLIQYQINNYWSDESEQFVNELLYLAILEANQEHANKITTLSLMFETSDDIFTEEFGQSLLPFTEINPSHIPPDYPLTHLTISTYLKYKQLRQLNPDWSRAKCIWYATKEMVHIGLDVFGMVPLIGEPADIINGVLYTIKGDKLNATLSYAGAVPLAGWAATGTKFAIKINEVATIGTKIKLVWKVASNGVIEFGSRNQLRKVLNITDSSIHAHHLIPWSTQSKTVVQKAAKSENAFHLNEALNGIPLNSTSHLTGHAQYTQKLDSILNYLHQNDLNMTPDEAYDHILALTNQIRNHVINHPNYNLGQIANLIVYP